MTQELDDLLEQAKLGALRCTILEILDIWSGFPVFDSDEVEPRHQIESAMKQDTDPTLEQLLRALSKLDCFSYRAFRADGPSTNERSLEFWHPLDETWRHFEKRALSSGAKLHYYQSPVEYPPSDVIRAWIKRRLHGTVA